MIERTEPPRPPAGPEAAASEEPSVNGVPSNGLTPPTRRGGVARFISDVLVELGFLTQERVDAAVDEARASGRTPEQVLLDSGSLSSVQLARATAERFGLQHADLAIYQPDLDAVTLIDAHSAKRFGAVPIGFEDGGALLVAMADPADVLALDDLKLMTGHEIRPVVASPDDIVALIGQMTQLDDVVAAAVEDEAQDLVPPIEIHETADDAPIVKLVTSIIALAVADGASDVHFEPEDRDMRVRFRIDGVLHETTSVPRRMIPGVVSRVKIMGNLDIAQRRVPQDGRTGLMVEGRSVDIRIVTMPSVRGEGIVLRLLTKEAGLMNLDKLGMGKTARERFEASFRQAFGAVMVTGPTGSGKSTTLYAALNSINSVERNVITVEDPVEYRLPGLNQLQVNYKAGLTFPAALRAMLRADPDVIMVGEIRDRETAQIAIEAALTGHLVLSTLHTNDAPSAIARLTEMGIEPFLIASSVDCVLAQRLARTLCTHCKRRVCITVEALRGAGFPADFELECYEPVGCERCNGTGYRGRVGVYEVMPLSDEIRALALARASADEVKAVARSQGMESLREDGLEKVKQGLTSIAEIARVT